MALGKKGGGGGGLRAAASPGDGIEVGFDYDGTPVIRPRRDRRGVCDSRPQERPPHGGPVKGDVAPSAPVGPGREIVLREISTFDPAVRGYKIEFVAEPQVGATMPDGTVYAGLSPDTGKAMYAVPADAKLTMKWQWAMDYAAEFKGHGYARGAFRVPTKDELTLLFQNRAAIGGFKEAGSNPGGWYWSSTERRDKAAYAWDQSLYGGSGDWSHKSYELSLRLVRS